jgi:hypothetical protein
MWLRWNMTISSYTQTKFCVVENKHIDERLKQKKKKKKKKTLPVSIGAGGGAGPYSDSGCSFITGCDGRLYTIKNKI